MQESVTRRVGWWGRLGAGSKRPLYFVPRNSLQNAPFPARCPPLPFDHGQGGYGTFPQYQRHQRYQRHLRHLRHHRPRAPAHGHEGDGGGGGGVGHLKADMHVRAKYENDGAWRFCPSISGSRRCTSTFMTGSKCGERHERLAWKQHLRRRATDREPPRFCVLLLTSEHERM
jgi:hypothetical protein